MDRKSFLSTLRRTLWWRLPPEELSAVLEDYNEYFDSGIAEGRSEADLSAQFGKPSEIAIDIVAERGSKYYSIALASMGLCAGLLLIAIVSLVHPSWLYETTYNDFILHFGIFVLSSLSVLLTKRTVTHSFQRGVSRRITITYIVIYGVCLLAIMTFIELINSAIGSGWFTPLLSMVDNSKLGPTFSLIIMLLVSTVIVLWLVTIFLAATLRYWQLAFVPVNAMILSLMVNFIIILGQLSDPAAFMPSVSYAVRLSLLQLLPILLLLTPIKRRAR